MLLLLGAPMACFAGSRTDLLLDDEADSSMPFSQDEGGADVADAGILDTGFDGHKYAWKAMHCDRDLEAGLPPVYVAPGGNDGDSGIYGETWDMPQAVNFSGPVVKRPLFVPITFSDYDQDQADEVEDFIASVGCTPYWKAITKDYGIGTGSSAKPVRLTETAWTKIADTGIQTWLRGKLDAKDPAFEPNTSDVIYAIFVPYTTTVTLQGQPSCQAFGGYHNATKLSNGNRVAYAVLPDCGGFDQLTSALSHELIEAATDPYPQIQPGYGQTDDGHLTWSLVAGGEVGDLCEFNNDAYFMPQGFPWTVQRTWSNSEAFAGRDPCVPAAATPWVAAIPDQPDVIHFFNNAMKGIKMAPNDVRTINLKLVSTSMQSFSVSAKDIASFQGGTPHLSFTVTPSSGKAGDTLQLKIAKTSNDNNYGIEIFAVFASGGGKTSMYWAATSAK
jgi:hypothetical protein